MALKAKQDASKSGRKPSGKISSSTSSKLKKTNTSKPKPQQHRPAPSTAATIKTKKKPPHLRYTEKELKVPQLNGIRPTGVQKLPNKKKGKQFVDDGNGMRTILAMVMAEKEGNIESKMMRARQMEEIREARRVEAEQRAESKKAGLEERKADIKKGKNKMRRRESEDMKENAGNVAEAKTSKQSKKKVSFG